MAKEKATNKIGNEIILSVRDNKRKNIHEYYVELPGVFGFGARFYCESSEDARALFNALKTVQAVEET